MKTRTLSPLAFIASIVLLSAFLEKPVPTKFTVDTSSSTLVWTGRKVTGEHTGEVKISSGQLAVEGSQIRQGNFEIDLSSITVTDVKDPGANAKLVGHLKAEDFFHVAAHPKASFSITSVSPKTANESLVKGNLIIKGITNEIEFPAQISIVGKKLTATGRITVNRTKYNIKFGSASFFENLGDKAIYDDFELDLRLVATTTDGI